MLIAFIEAGGTITNTERGRVGVEDVLTDIQREHPMEMPSLDYQVTLAFRQGAEEFTPSEWCQLSQLAQAAADDPATEAVIVTHGTYTAEETAYFLHLTVHTEKPVVLTCAQRRHGALGSDGDRNLFDAIAVALTAEARGKGVLVVANEEIHSARDVTKTNQRPSGFVSRGVGLLGSVEADQVTFYRVPTRRHTAGSEFLAPVGIELPRVDITAAYPGADGVAIQALIDVGTRGIVVDGFSFAGKPHRLQEPALERAIEAGIAVVLANRGRDGRVPVGKSDGFVRADNLSAAKAHVLLSLALTVTADGGELQRIFGDY